jgi:plasminogen activator inhibitor 1 RNA-binding protein
MTLEEWRAKNGPAETVAKLEPRKIAEGSSMFFKDAKQLLKTEDNDYFAGKVRHACQIVLYSTNHFQQPKTTSAPRPRKETKQFIEIDAHFDPPSRGGRGRGGRGGRGGYGDSPRGDRPERGGRGGRGGYGGGGGGGRNQQQRAVDMEDTNAFPSL